MIHVIAIVTTRPGQRDRVLEEVRANTAAVLGEVGCIEYSAVVDAPNPAPAWAPLGPDSFAIVEKWASRDALRAHATAPHMAAYAAKVKDLVVGRTIHVLEAAS